MANTNHIVDDEDETLYENTAFEQILRNEISCTKLYEDELCMAVINTQARAPIHYVVFPRKKISQLTNVEQEDIPLLGHLLLTAKKVAHENGLQDGYRIIINNGHDADQHHYYLHVHILGGCKGARTYFIKK